MKQDNIRIIIDEIFRIVIINIAYLIELIIIWSFYMNFLQTET